MGDEAHVNVLMIYHPNVVPGVFLLPLYVAHTARVIDIKSKLDAVTSLLKTFPQFANLSLFVAYKAPHSLAPASISVSFPTILPLICTATRLWCCSWTMPSALLPPGLCTCFSPSAWNVFPLHPSSQGSPCTFCTDGTYQRSLP